MTQSRPLSQSELKRLVARAALDYVESGAVLGVGTGSTVDQLIDQLPEIRDRIPACVSSSERSTKRLEALGFKVLDMNEVDSIGVYIDGADEIDGHFAMIKGGGGALTRRRSWRVFLAASSALPMRRKKWMCWDVSRFPLK
jgi:ribose 5-phosphate isomerase A